MKLNDDIDLVSGAIGGLILGVASSGLIYFQDRITGISGLLEASVLRGEGLDISYILGLCSSGYILMLTKPDVFGGPRTTFTSGTCSVIISGLAVGFGSRLGNGCTSGHGICGLPRLSPRSLAAVITFMITGAISAYSTRQYRIPVNSFVPFIERNGQITETVLPFLFPTVISVSLAYLINKHRTKSTTVLNISNALVSFTFANLFGFGLGIAGMLNPQKVINFLDFTGAQGWDPSLMAVMGGGVLFNLVTFSYLKKNSVKIKYGLDPVNLKVDFPLIFGSALFGIGWGWTGQCPGPAAVSFGGTVGVAKYFVPSMILGMKINDLFKREASNKLESVKYN